MEEVHGTIEWAKDKLDSFPKAKKELGPLLDALGRTPPFRHYSFCKLSSDRVYVSQNLWPKLLAALRYCWPEFSTCSENWWVVAWLWTPCSLTSDNVQLSGLGLDSLLKGIISATVSIYILCVEVLLIGVVTGSWQDLLGLGARQVAELWQEVKQVDKKWCVSVVITRDEYLAY